MSLQRTNKEKLFGTDGIRGTPGTYPLTDGMVFKIGKSIARCILYKRGNKGNTKVVIGRDTRLTGHRLETILADAINFYGIDVYIAGTITTPGLAFLTKDCGADMGIMISASHNKPTDNGIKLFNAEGNKLSQEEEEWIEDIIFSSLVHFPNGVEGMKRGKVLPLRNAQSKYLKFLASSLEGLNLKGLKVAVDCAHGAAAPFAKKLFKKLGATVVAIHDTPSGEHINAGGAIDPSILCKVVKDKKADIGIAVDGDGDRGIMIDEKGNILDGDHILAISASYASKKKKLAKNTIVTTVMCNLGLKMFLKSIGVDVITTKVGDKYVLESLLKNGCTIGGEQSGHVLFLDYLSTPDGLLTGLQMLKVMKATHVPLSTLSCCVEKLPQVLVNVKVKERKPFEQIGEVAEKLKYFSEKLKDEGRILLRYSGTEFLARIMVEGKDKQEINNIANDLAEYIRGEIGVETNLCA